MAPADYQGRSAGAPVKGPRGLIVSIAECEPGNGPGLHRHLNTVENFFCLSGRFEISWGDKGEHKTVLEPNDMISVPRGENRKFFNIGNEVGRLLVMIVPETDQQVDPISYAPSLAQGDRERIRQEGAGGPADHRLQVRGAGGLAERAAPSVETRASRACPGIRGRACRRRLMHEPSWMAAVKPGHDVR